MPMNNTTSWRSIAHEIRGEIMKTDIYCEIQCEEQDEALAYETLEKAFDLFREFEVRYSRFRRDNTLWQFNHATKPALSSEFFSTPSAAKKFNKETNGIFDPGILPALEK